MPELPEVEFVARQLRADLVGRRIRRAEVFWPRAIQWLAVPEFEAGLAGRVVTAIDRRGKYLLIYLDDGAVLLVHRRMSGNLRLAAPDEDEPYVRVAITLDDGRRLLYTDPRKFGRLALARAEELPALFAALGPEPLDASFTVEALAARLAGRRGPIKAALLDQSVVSGLGNIYADEALFRAGLHPLRPAGSLDSAEVAALLAGIVGALRAGIEHGGTTFSRYRDAYGESRMNRQHLQVYQRTGEPCHRCGTPIERIVVAQRGTHFCPSCQR
jgi:formamidopyrimidine-DNA glycosylase